MKFTKKFAWQNLHIYFFYLFLFFIPLQTRKVFLTKYSFYSGDFTEYATFFVYFSDLLLAIALIFWIVFKKHSKHSERESLVFQTTVANQELRQKKEHKNRILLFLQTFNFNLLKSFLVSSSVNLNIKSTDQERRITIFALLLLFLFWMIVNAITVSNYLEISFFQTIKFIELFLLVLFVYFNLKSKNKLLISLFVISVSGFAQGVIGIYQFINQHPLFKDPFLRTLIGESTVYPHIPGIAKIVIDSEKVVRAYGTFPHPNVFGGFLIFSIAISIYLLLEHKKYILSIIETKCALFYNIKLFKSQTYSSFIISFLWIVLIFTQIAALLFTFSRTAWAGFLLCLLIIALFYLFNTGNVQKRPIGINIFYGFLRNVNKALKLNFIFKRLHSRKFSKIFKIVSRETISFFHKANNFLKEITFFILKSKVQGLKRKKKYENGNSFIFQSLRHKLIHKISNFRNKKLFFINNTIKSIGIQREIFVVFLLTIFLIGLFSSPLKSRIFSNLISEDRYFSNNIENSDDFLNNFAINDRIFYNNVSRETISENFLTGSGHGTFIFQIEKYLATNNFYGKIEPWKYQPAHNIYFLITSEVGIIGFSIFIFFIFSVISITTNKNRNSYNLAILNKNNKIVSRETLLKSKLTYFMIAVLLSFLFIGLFDHYFWTLQQGRLVFWLILGILITDYSS